MLRIAERDARYLNLNPKCEPRLGKRGLFRATGGKHPGEFEHALLWVLNQSDGSHSLLDIAEKSRLPFDSIAAAADALEAVDLLRRQMPERAEMIVMKVVLFCGGLGTRLREHSDTIPKPLVNIGYRPIVWHLMRYYAHFGHKDFILCLGYRGDLIREYFLYYREELTNDFVLHPRTREDRAPVAATSADWKITFVETGCTATSASAC